ncbi:L,D-transpeptidase [Tropicimonas marinistellae]|uniref:L,D-transpeptidase n=1 Tax=Tropicimonas marinistellae TaxID=1739787 RepID=UPI0008329DAB|nr:L,D-transpeptidase [Tropicimonas marinistellae]
MIDRRHLLLSATAAAVPLPALAASDSSARLPKKFRPQIVSAPAELAAGEIHVVPDDHFLYWTLGDGKARRYGIAVGAPGRNFKGVAHVRRKAEWPSWTPTADMIRKEPSVYGKWRNGLPGGHEKNPMGSRALYLYQGNRDTLYRIHGTPQPWTIGRSFSSGCIRLQNPHVEELYAHVPLGTRVVVY